MQPLSTTSLSGLPEEIGRPGYDRGRLTPGIMHFSVGNFHRAHQAVYLDRCLALAGQDGWGILRRRPDPTALPSAPRRKVSSLRMGSNLDAVSSGWRSR